MRVLHCIPGVFSASGGPTRALVEMCRAVHAVDPSILIDVASTDYLLTPEWREHLVSRLPATTTLRIFPTARGLDAGWSPAMVRWLWKNANEYDVLHVHALFQSTASACASTARCRGVPYVIRPLGTLSPYTFRTRRRILKQFYFRALDRGNLTAAAFVHFTAPQEATKAARLGMPLVGRVIPIPVEVSPISSAPRDEDHLLFLSRIHPVKGVELLLESLPALVKERPALRLTIAGSGENDYVQSIRARVAALGLESAVTFTGFVDGRLKEELLERATVFVLPSYQENFGVAVAEALSAGLPVLITREIDIWPDVAKCASGVVVGTDVTQIREAIRSMLADETVLVRMGEAGRRHVAELYSHERVGSELVRMYEAASSSRAGRSP